MILSHVSVIVDNEDSSDTYYMDVLELEKINSKILSPDISKKDFDLELKIINYGNNDLII